MRYRDKELDNKLVTEIMSEAPRDEVIRKLVGEGANINSVRDEQSVLIEAINNDVSVDVLRSILELGADVNYAGEEGWTALAEACIHHPVEYVSLLLGKGAYPNTITEHDGSILDLVRGDMSKHELESTWEGGQGDNVYEVERLKQLERILLAHGARTISELRTDSEQGMHNENRQVNGLGHR